MMNNVHSIPLPEGQELAPGPVCYSACVFRVRFFLETGAGAFNSTERLQGYNRRLEITQHFHHAPPDRPSVVFQEV
jgi:hypothetical protein